MFVAVGVLAPVAGVFHLVTHAFFKALLFLSSGVVMHAMAGELDLRKMSGLKRVLPWTRWLMLIGCLALAAFPFFSGFLSKDEIVAAAWNQSKFLALLLLITAFLTSYYTFRLYFRVFEGPLVVPHADAHGAHDAESEHAEEPHHSHEPVVMIFPLVILAIGAIFAGFINFPERAQSLGAFLGTSPSIVESFHTAVRANDVRGRLIAPLQFGQFAEHEDEVESDPDYAAKERALHLQLMIVSGLVSVLGIYVAYVMHLKFRQKSQRLAERFPEITSVLEHKYWVDEIYQNAIVEPLRDLGRLFFAIDRLVIDGIVGLMALVPQLSGFALKLSTQRGYLQGYAVTMLFGIAAILLIVFM
jgi:NADH-quinone oxidoreductase subunit L